MNIKELNMATKLEKKSHKSLIFLLIKQRNVINTLVRKLKTVLVENEKLKDAARILEILEESKKFYKEKADSNFKAYLELAEVKMKLEKEVAYLKGKLGERSVDNAN